MKSLANSGSDKAYTVGKSYRHILEPIVEHEEEVQEDLGQLDQGERESSDTSDSNDFEMEDDEAY